MKVIGLNTKGLTLFPKTEKETIPCKHKYGAVATWSHCTDTLESGYANAEINAFKNNLALTAFINPFTSLFDVDEIKKTGRIKYGIYFPGDRWSNPSISNIPDFNATEWTSAGVNAGFITSDKIGTSKPFRYPNHGQEMYDLTNGLYGFDVINGIAGEIDVLTGLVEHQVNWFFNTFNKHASSASYRYGATGAQYRLYDYLLGVRNSDYDYGNNYSVNHWDSCSRGTTTRQSDMAGSRAQVQSECVTYLQNAIANGGWYSDFTHWHTSPDTEIEEYYANQRNAMGANDVVSLDFGTALEHMFLREMVRRISLFTDNTEIKIIVELKNNDYLPLRVIETPLSVHVELTGTILEGVDIEGIGSAGIRKITTDHFIVEVPYSQKDGFLTVTLKETTTPDYLDFSIPVINSVEKNADILSITTDKLTKVVVYNIGLGGQLYEAIAVKRSSDFSNSHNIDVSGIDFLNFDTYIGVITEQNQSILSTKYNF